MKNLIVDLASYINIVSFGSDQFQSVSVRQEVQSELGIEDIRVSLDSSDLPHLHWLRALIDGRIRSYHDPQIDKGSRRS